MFLTHSDEALEIKKFKRSRKNKIEFAYDYRNLNASYVNEKINFKDGYFQEIINPDFEKIDSPFQQTSSLKPYVPNCVSPISISKSSCDSNNVEIKLKRKRHLDTFSSVRRPRHRDVNWKKKWSSNTSNVDLDTFSSVRRPRHSGVIWKKKGSSNTSNVGLSVVSVPNLNNNVKRYSRKDLLACNNSHLGETRSVFVCT
nr:hypothetical protein [Tanacetum cinerariifolium]